MPAAKHPSTTYETHAEFDAPLLFVFRWCTDYDPGDARLEKEEYDRRIVRREARRVVYEDLYDLGTGWMWSRHTVTLSPPDRWHSDSVGSHREWSLDYRLRALPGDRTELTLTGVRTPTRIGTKNPPKSRFERELAATWANFGKALERDYRKTQKARPRTAP